MKHVRTKLLQSFVSMIFLYVTGCGSAQSAQSDRTPALDPAPVQRPEAYLNPAELPAAAPAPPESSRSTVTLPAPLPPPSPLRHTFDVLSALQRGEPARLRVLQVGDSHVASDTWGSRLRTALAERFGDAGRGYLYAGLPWDSYRMRHAEYDASDGWEGTLGVRSSWDGVLAAGGTRIETAEPGQFVVRSTCDDCAVGAVASRVRVTWLAQPGGGDFELRVGDRAETVRTDAPQNALGVTTVDVAPGPVTMRIETLGGPVALFGTSFELDEPGVIVEAVGMNGGRADQWADFDDAIARDEVAALDPDLVLIAFGTNEAYGSRYRVDDPDDAEEVARVEARLATYAAAFERLVRRYVEPGDGADCVVVHGPDFVDDGAGCVRTLDVDGERACIGPTPDSIGRVRAVQAEVAARLGCATWDAQSAMGGPGSQGIWEAVGLAAGDGVHLTQAGYSALADALLADVFALWEADRLTTAEAGPDAFAPTLQTSLADPRGGVLNTTAPVPGDDRSAAP